VSGLFCAKTKMPGIVWLLLGYLLGPVLGLFDKEMFLAMFSLIILVTAALFFDTDEIEKGPEGENGFDRS